MRKLIIVFLFISFNSFAQQCSEALVMKKGTILEYTSFTKKGKEDGKSVFETLNVTKDGNQLIADIKATILDSKKKGNDFSVQHKAYCENGVFSIDMLRFFDTSKLKEYQNGDNDIKIDIDGNVLRFPSEMEVGTTLNDGTITIKVGKEDITLVTITSNITNRKVTGKETITTPAGTFECNKVTFDFDTKIGILRVRGSAAEWYDKDKVVVKSESYNKKGKVISTSKLTAIK